MLQHVHVLEMSVDHQRYEIVRALAAARLAAEIKEQERWRREEGQTPDRASSRPTSRLRRFVERLRRRGGGGRAAARLSPQG